MRISINARRIEGPYGGGNQFANTLEKYLCLRNHELFRELVPDLDVILIHSSQKELKITAYNLEAIKDYVALNPNTIVVQRVNTCDEQRGADLGINRAILVANELADHTVYVSHFVRDLFIQHGIDPKKSSSIVLNAADEELFNPDRNRRWAPPEHLRVVTHHWSSNYMKGFDIYERLDELLDEAPLKDHFRFTVIGNVPLGAQFRNARVIPPTFGHQLGALLKQHHVYLTAARHEPGPNHVAEALACGLPVLYLRSGALPEYCGSYGIEFTLSNFEEKLLEMRERYLELRKRVLRRSYRGSWMGAQYEAMFKQLIAERRAHPRSRPGLEKTLRHVVHSCRKKVGRLRKAL